MSALGRNSDLPVDGSDSRTRLKRKKRKFRHNPKEQDEDGGQPNQHAPVHVPTPPGFLHLARVILESEHKIEIIFPGSEKPRNAFARIGHGGTFLVYAELRTMSDAILASPEALRSLAERMVLKRTRPMPAAGRNDNSAFLRYAAIFSELQILLDEDISQHENFIDILGLTWDFEESANGSLGAWPVLALEAATATMDDVLREFAASDAPLSPKLEYCRDVARGLAFLHQKGVAHCDIKAENVLICVTNISGSVAKLSDFGSAILDVTPETDLPLGIAGTRPWNAPEYGRHLRGLEVFKTDVFSFGMLVWRSVAPDGILRSFSQSTTTRPEYEEGLSNIATLKTAGQLVDTAANEARESCADLESLHELLFLLRSTLEYEPSSRASMALITEHIQTLVLLSSGSEEKSNVSTEDDDAVSLREKPKTHDIQTSLSFASPKNLEPLSPIPPLPATPFCPDFDDIFQCFQDEAPVVKRQLVDALSDFARNAGNLDADRAEAALLLSFAHYNGFGTVQDLQEGFRWLAESARHGHIKARAWALSLSTATPPPVNASLLPTHAAMVGWLCDAAKYGLFEASVELRDVNPFKHEEAMDALRLARCLGEDTEPGLVNNEELLADHCRGQVPDALSDPIVLSNGYCPLHIAAALGYRSIVHNLVASAVDIEIRSVYGETALLCACRAGFADIAKYLLEKGARVTATDEGESPLHWLISFFEDNVTAMAQSLHYRGADLEAENDGTPLVWAVSARHPEAVRVLVECGADPFNGGGEEKPIITAVSAHLYDIVEILLGSPLSTREQVTGRDADGNTLLYHAVYCHGFIHRLRRHRTAVAEAGRRTIRLLLDYGCDASNVDKDGFSILDLAAGYGDADLVGMLLKHFDFGDLLNKAHGDPPRPPLLQAIASGRLEVVKRFLAAGVDTCYTTPDGESILHLLASISDEEYALKCMSLLSLSERADKNSLSKHATESPSGITPLESALITGHLDVARMLLDNGADPDGPARPLPHFLGLLICEQSWTSPAAVQFYLKHIGQPFIINDGNASVLHVAASRLNLLTDDVTSEAKLDILLALFHNEAEINAQTIPKDGVEVWGYTPMHMAARMGVFSAVKRLLEHGAKPDVQDSRGQTPLENAKDMLEYILERILPHEMSRLMADFRDTIELLEAVKEGRQWPMLRLRQQDLGGQENIRTRFSALGFEAV